MSNLNPTCFTFSIYTNSTGPSVNHEQIGHENYIYESNFIGIGTPFHHYVINICDIISVSDVCNLNPDITWTEDLEKKLLSFLPNKKFPSDNIKG